MLFKGWLFLLYQLVFICIQVAGVLYCWLDMVLMLALSSFRIVLVSTGLAVSLFCAVIFIIKKVPIRFSRCV